jgi:hypothetical protein
MGKTAVGGRYTQSKRHRPGVSARPSPQELLADVVRGLQHQHLQEDTLGVLLIEGPYSLPVTLIDALFRGTFDTKQIWAVCAHLAAFLAELARGKESPFDLFHPPRYVVSLDKTGERLTIAVRTTIAAGRTTGDEGHTLRDLAFMQFLALLQVAGTSRVRVCDAPMAMRDGDRKRGYVPCGRLFIKTGKQKFCTPRCQKRVATQGQRRRERLERDKERHRAVRHRVTRR